MSRSSSRRRRSLVAAIAAGSVVTPSLPNAAAFPPVENGSGCDASGNAAVPEPLAPETDLRVWFTEGSWENGLRDAVLSRLEEWQDVYDPSGERYISSVALGSESDHNVKFEIRNQDDAATLCVELPGIAPRGFAYLSDQFNVPGTNPDAETIWASGAAALAHELGHSFLLGHAGTYASGGTLAAPPVMNTCPLDVSGPSGFSHLHVQQDDHAALVNRSWAMEDRALYDAPMFAGGNPGFEGGTEALGSGSRTPRSTRSSREAGSTTPSTATSSCSSRRTSPTTT